MAEPLPFLYIRVPVDIDDHPKVMPLGHAAFRLLIKALGWCRKWAPDACIPIGVWRRWVSKRAREELLQDRLAEFTETGDIDLVFYRELRQQSQQDIDDAKQKAKAKEGGQLGAHRRHHANRGVVDPTCRWCATPAGDLDSPPSSPPIGPPTDQGVDPLPGFDGVPVAEIEGEVEGEIQADHPRHRQVVDARDDEDDHAKRERIEGQIAAAMAAATADQVRLSPDEARRVRVLLLAGRTDPDSPRYVYDPVSYVVGSIRKDPARVLAELRRPMADHLAGHADEMWTTVPSRPAWCGECNEHTRMIDVADDRVRRCPRCNPNFVEAEFADPTPAAASPAG